MNPTIVFTDKSAITATRGVSDPELGVKHTFADEPQNEYVYGYNAANSEVYPGFHVQLNSAATNMSFTLTNATNTGLSVGIVKNSTFTTGTYGWLLKKGFVAVEMNTTSGTVAARAQIGAGVNGLCTPVTLATGVLSPAFGYAMAEILSSASGSAYVSMY